MCVSPEDSSSSQLLCCFCNDVENGIALSTGISFLVADFCISLESYFHDLVIYPWLLLPCHYSYFLDDRGNTTQVVQTHIFHFRLLKHPFSPAKRRISTIINTPALLFAYYISVISFTTPATATLMDCMRFLQSFAQQ